MSTSIELDWSKIGRKWVSYFDLLGFKHFVREHPPERVFAAYSICLEEFKRHEKREKNWSSSLKLIHFSDSFLIYTPDDTAGSFAALESASRWFFNFVLLRGDGFPLRGAMACDEFYADKSNGVFFGKALVEAHEYGEKFDWIGFVLSPSAVCRMANSEVNLPANERLNYREWNAPAKRVVEKRVVTVEERITAYLIGASSSINDQNIYIPKLESMAQRADDPGVKAKYFNTIRFLKHFGILRPVTTHG